MTSLARRSATRIGPWRICVLEEPAHGGPNEDEWLITSFGAGARLAVLDGVASIGATPRLHGLPGGAAAAALVRAALRGPADPGELLGRTNATLCLPGLPARARPQTCALVADLDPRGRVELVRAGDSEAYARRARGDWTPLFAPPRDPAAVAAWAAILAADPALAADWPRRNEAEEPIWGRQGAWSSDPVGRHERPRFETVSLAPDAWDELVLATDGADFRVRGLEGDPFEAAGAVCQGEHPDAPWHGDITVLWIRRS